MDAKSPKPDPAGATKTAILAAAGAIVLGALAAYRGGLSGPFVFDDIAAITNNATIRHLWPLGPVLSPRQGGVTTSGRPLVNLSFALNYALTGTRVWSYHAVNLLIHTLAGLTLFGIVRRTLARWRGLPSTRALTLALATALLWTVHPLQTEAVTYTVQRAESLMGLFYLLTLYGFIRYADEMKSGRAFRFGLLSIAACLLGMATKEVMVSAPLIVLLYDCTFVSGRFREAWRRRRGYYLCLAATWIPLAYFVLGTKSRGGTAGFDIPVSAWSYWLTQFPATGRYLALAAWPHPLAFDYGNPVVHTAAEVLPSAAIVLALMAGTAWALLRPGSAPCSAEGALPPRGGMPALGFLGAFFFAVLAPTALVPVVVQTMAEHRLYLALAPVAAVAVCGGYFRFGRLQPRLYFLLLSALALGLIAVTARRNEDYRSALALWRSAAAARPTNPRAQYNLGLAFHQTGDDASAIGPYVESLRFDPQSFDAHNNLGTALAATGRWPEAIAQFREALRLKPDFLNANYNLGNALLQAGDPAAAIASFQRAIQLSPDDSEAYYNLGVALTRIGQPTAALAAYEKTLRLKPDYVAARTNLGAILVGLHRVPEGIAHYREALRLQPDDAKTHNDLGIALAATGHLSEAIGQFQQAIGLDPGFYFAHLNLGHALKLAGRTGEAEIQFQEAARINPDRAPAPP